MNEASLMQKMKTLALSLIAISVVVGVVAVAGLYYVSHVYGNIPDVNLPNIVATNRLMLEVRLTRVNILQIFLEDAPAELIESSLAAVTKARGAYEDARKMYEDAPSVSPEEQKAFEDTKAAGANFFSLIDKILALQKNKPAEGTPALTEVLGLVGKDMPIAAKKFAEQYTLLEKLNMDAAREGTTLAERVEYISYGTMLIFVLAASFVGFTYSQRFASLLVNKLTEVSTSLNEASVQVSAASSQIASTSAELSSSTSEQASSLAETAASIEEMNSMVAKNTENSKNAAQESTEAEQTAIRGQRGVENMIASMEEISESNQQVADIVKVIREIGDKTKVINDIVFQTKLLSFNASVEAARAGEHGKGFAVVAEEVGNLAQMSGNAAKEITDLLDSSVQKVEAIVDQTKSKVEAGTITARECGEILREIVGSVAKVTAMAGDISVASSEQATGVGEITKAMNQLDQVTQQNAASSEQAASAAAELSAQAESMTTLVSDLMTVVNGSNTGAHSPVAHAPVPAPALAKTAKVLPMKKRATPARTTKNSPAPQQKVANGDYAPSFNDSRFEDM